MTIQAASSTPLERHHSVHESLRFPAKSFLLCRSEGEPRRSLLKPELPLEGLVSGEFRRSDKSRDMADKVVRGVGRRGADRGNLATDINRSADRRDAKASSE